MPIPRVYWVLVLLLAATSSTMAQSLAEVAGGQRQRDIEGESQRLIDWWTAYSAQEKTLRRAVDRAFETIRQNGAAGAAACKDVGAFLNQIVMSGNARVDQALVAAGSPLQDAAMACSASRFSAAQMKLLAGKKGLDGVDDAIAEALAALGRELENQKRQAERPAGSEKFAITDSILPKRSTPAQILEKLGEIRRDIDHKMCAEKFPEGGFAEEDCRLKAHRRYDCEITYQPSLVRELCIANSQH